MKLNRERVLVSTFAAGLLVMGTACTTDELPPSPPVVSSTIADVAQQNPEFSTLVAALSKAGLVDTLKGAGPFTVFAPNNQAFIDSGITSLDDFSAESLKTILLYHVISGNTVVAADVTAGPHLSAADLTFFVGTDSGVTINGGSANQGGAAVKAADIAADNGVIHVIDRVMLPPDIATCATYGGLGDLVNAVGAASAMSDGTSVLAALKSEGPLTVFAPTNAAFAKLGAAPSGDALRDVLLYHVTSGAVDSSAIPAIASSLLQNTWQSGVSLIFDSSAGVKVNTATVQIADIKCTNGVVHVIDQVLLPPNVAQMAAIAGLDSLLGAVTAAADIGDTSVADALQADAPYTVFAPTNDAFAAIVAPTDPIVLRDILLLHVVNAGIPVLSAGLPTTPTATLSASENLSFDSTGPTVSSDGTAAAKIGPADIHVTNGVIHLIDKVLLP